ncbi:Short-chain dehydrogenase/reductase family protein [Mycena sanguinolenta]|uniref:Short-chain dehydrogenase/reductase family protein n=1 Tax=Mycena sanguinolenta TaxID=230812 RepID=A0A8H6Z0D5_9AGAR|nr:Short-chain dehydrogenase/reductase family protein [Mycena sanguinolenta]
MTSAPRSSPVILITGCSKGFGRELSALALDRGFRVIATARHVETLVTLKEQGAEILPLDVTAPPSTITAFAAIAWGIYGHIDFLINNAAYLQCGAIEENTLEETMIQFNTNVFGLLNTTNAFLPYFRARRAGMIVNISSQGGCVNMEGTGIYCASKAAVDSLSDTWARELAEFNVKCISIQVPGLFRTTVASTMRRGSRRIPGYTVADKVVVDYKAASGTEPGDPTKAMIKILDLITAEGIDLPLRFPLGDDAYENVKSFYLERLAEMEKFKVWSVGTNFN